MRAVKSELNISRNEYWKDKREECETERNGNREEWTVFTSFFNINSCYFITHFSSITFYCLSSHARRSIIIILTFQSCHPSIVSHFSLIHTLYCSFSLLTLHLSFQTSHPALVWLLLTSYLSLFAAHSILHSTHSSLFVGHSLLVIAHLSLLICCGTAL